MKQKDAADFMQIQITGFQTFRLLLTPPCCRTRYQKALARLFKKAEHKLHREMNIGTLIKSIRDSALLVKSYSRSRVFSP